MKKIVIICGIIIIIFGIVFAPLLSQVISLKKSNDFLSKQNEELIVQMTDLNISGEFTVFIHAILIDLPNSNENSAHVVMSLFQSELFLLAIDNRLVSQLKEGNIYTFRINKNSQIKDYPYNDYKENNYTLESILNYETVKFSLVGIAKKNETGLESNRLKVEEVIY